MKNPFINEDSSAVWITAAVAGALAAGVGIWFYLQGKRSAAMEAYRHEHARDYLEAVRPKKKKKQKTDVSELSEFVNHHG